MEKQQKIIEAFESMKRCQVISKHLLLTNAITGEKLAEHAKYVTLEPGEKPLFMVDVHVALWGLVTGLLVTDRNVYYRCMKIKALFRGLTMLMSSRNMGKVALDRITEISLGTVVFDGSTYCGHRFSINGNVVGSLSLGSGLTFDDKLVENLKLLFNALV